MPNIERYSLPGMPQANALEVVTVSARKAGRVNAESLFESTAHEFERVRTGYPVANPTLQRIERAYHSLRGRDVRHIGTLAVSVDPTIGDSAEVLVSPVARLSDRSGAFCVTARAATPGSSSGAEYPYPAGVISYAKNSLQLHQVHEPFIDLADEQRGIANVQLEPLGEITPGSILSLEQKLGLGAVYLGLKASSWA